MHEQLCSDEWHAAFYTGVSFFSLILFSLIINILLSLASNCCWQLKTLDVKIDIYQRVFYLCYITLHKTSWPTELSLLLKVTQWLSLPLIEDDRFKNFTQLSAKSFLFRRINWHTIAKHAYDQIRKYSVNGLRSLLF